MKLSVFAVVFSLAVVAGVAASTRPAHADEEANAAPVATSGTHVAAKLEAGVSYRQIFTLPVVGPEAAVGIGVVQGAPGRRLPEIYILARYAYGETEYGLGVHAARLASQLELPFGRVRPAIGLDLIWLGIDRTTEPGLVQHWGLGLNGSLTVDVIRTSERSALYVGPGVTLDMFPHLLIPRTLSWSSSLAVGYRF